MTQEKMRRIISACVSACTLLLVVLVCFCGCQRIKIYQNNKRIESIKAEIAYYEDKLKNTTDMLEYYESEYYLEKAYRELMELQGDKK